MNQTKKKKIMCGRFSLSVDPVELMEMIPRLKVKEDIIERFNVAPTQQIATVLNYEEPSLEFTHWGLIPFWAKDPSIGNKLINARAETVHEKPSFRDSFRKRRCLILADGFYEWKADKGKRTKIPYFFRLKSGKPFAFAGLWDTWKNPEGEPITSSTIITTTPNEVVAPVHRRMPVILPVEELTNWLNPKPLDTDTLRQFLKSYPASEMEAYPVTTNVNNPRNDDPTLLMPLFDR